MNMLPSQFHAQTASDFIGPARLNALYIEQLVAQSQPIGAPIKLLILGPPGVGKSDLAGFLARLLHIDKWSLQKFNGTQLKIETVDDLARDLRMTNLFGEYRLIQIEEVDKVPTVAQVRLLTVLDDLPPRTAVVATSNCKKSELENRFQRRFGFIEVEPPTAPEITEFLTTRFNIPPAQAHQIASFAYGCVGQALMDADAAYVLNQGAVRPPLAKAA